MRTQKRGVLLGIVIAFVAVLIGTIGTPLQGKAVAASGINQQMAFEGKVVLANGTNIPNGTYNMEFKIYTGGTNTGSGTLQWTEDYLVGGSGGVTTTDGTFEVNLGAITSLSSVNWNSDTLFLSMQVGNSSSCTLSTTFQANCGGDGEMSPYIRLTSVPYAFNSNAVGGLTASQLVQLSPGSQQTGAVNVSGAGTFGGAVQGASVAATSGVTGASLTATGTVQGATVTATGALQGNSLSVNSGAFSVSSGGLVNSQTASYTTNQVLINDGQTTAPPAFPNSYTPALTIVTAETSGSRPLFFGYNAGTGYGAFLTSGACSSFTQMCLDLGNGATGLTALENIGTTLNVGGGDDGNFTTVAIAPSGAATTVGGSLTVAGVANLNGGLSQSISSGAATSTVHAVTATDTNTSATASIDNGLSVSLVGTSNTNSTNTLNGLSFSNVTPATNNTFNGLTFGTGYTNLLSSANFSVAASGNVTNNGTYNGNTLSSSALTFSGASANAISSTSGQNLTVQSQGAGQLNLASGSGTIGLGVTTATIQRTAAGSTTLDLNDSGTTTLILKNSGSGVANLDLYGGSLQTGSTPVTRLDNTGNLLNIGNFTSAAGTTFTTTGANGFTFKPGTDNATAFQIQNAGATATLLAANTSTLTVTIAGTTTTFGSLTLTNSHFKSTQTTPPTIGTPSACGTTPTGAITANSTDSAGSFTLTSGTVTTTATCAVVITFNKPYAAAPKSIVVTGASAAAGKMTPAVSATSATTFTVTLPQTDATGTAYVFYYNIVE